MIIYQALSDKETFSTVDVIINVVELKNMDNCEEYVKKTRLWWMELTSSDLKQSLGHWMHTDIVQNLGTGMSKPRETEGYRDTIITKRDEFEMHELSSDKWHGGEGN